MFPSIIDDQRGRSSSFLPFMMNTKSAILIALAWRILIAVSTCTFFQPDEFYQSLEVAHRAVFGYGRLTWE